MRTIGVYVKVVPSTEDTIQIHSNGVDILKKDLRFVINPFDEFALEEALRYKDENSETKIIVITVGGEYSKESLRYALALGVDSVILINRKEYIIIENALALGSILREIAIVEKMDFILFGKETIDDNSSHLAACLGAMLDWNYCTNVLSTTFSNKISVTRELNNTTNETVELEFPCILSISKGGNQLRHPSVMNIIKSKTKEIKEYNYNDMLREDFQNMKLQFLKYHTMKKRNLIKESDPAKGYDQLVEIITKKLYIG